ncbi:Aldehyde dehydrogenase [Sphingobium indicum BiD32]|uniref:Aldehyde dehydrogenase n=1 Tax=Sphingobium indicum BiD32 TaxID=1301087 RepID=N1MSA7_9SPHN|nr:aldehyde dehydrogenase family protein [Sphingobium indicum]CCW20080.1 Aldehyde dehydrogenase [Sphingobium indicum BiD32]
MDAVGVETTGSKPVGAGILNDSIAIDRLKESLKLQKAAFRRNSNPSQMERTAHLRALVAMMAANRNKIRDALVQDFSAHPTEFSDLIEVAGVMGRAETAINRLPVWMAPDRREAEPMFGTPTAFMQYQPKGVIANVVPWNLPFELGCGPLAEMLAAGNRVILKPSEYTPACADVLEEMIAATFDRDHVTVSKGGLDLAKALPSLPWDHILYTGSTVVGRQIMAAAAENLVPLTLELGGKCPTIMTSTGLSSRNIQSVLGMKLAKNGQICVSVDHVLVHREQMEAFVSALQEYYRTNLNNHSQSPDCTGIITQRQLDRLVGLLDEANISGERVIHLEDSGIDRDRRIMPLTLIVDPKPGLSLMNEEIFGPILPIIPYDSIEDAIELINQRDRPLCINIYSQNPEEIDAVLERTISGGVTVNGAALNGVCPSLGFGGIGASGMGRHHGIEGFREFSNNRAVYFRSEQDNLASIFPPFGEATRDLVASIF